MDIELIRRRIWDMIEPLISELGVELEDIELNRLKNRFLLRIYIDKDGGVTIGDCERVSREIEAILDVEDPIPGSYILEVSSPGLDRPLKRPKDFIRFSGKKVRIVTGEPIEGQTFFMGRIIEADEDRVVVSLTKEREVSIPYGLISMARLEVEV
jgi:ribosome maturation factor RimP